LAMNSSKGGHVIAAGLIAVLLGVLALRSHAVIAKLGWKHLFAFGILLLCALTVLIVGTDTARSADRWLEYLRRTESDSRLATARICLGMLPAGGLFGTGPGTFVASFQTYVAASHLHEDAIWKYAHNDWLQYFVEWGFIGGAIWLILWSLPLRRAAEHLRVIVQRGFIWEIAHRRRGSERRHRSIEALRQYLTFGASLSLLGVAVHALFDFPLQIMSLQIYAFTLAGMLVSRSRQESLDEAEAEEEDEDGEIA
ncbi:MAG TPA: O-antigen ligase family protein, partial [Verrucomicrobiaceae bacterium]